MKTKYVVSISYTDFIFHDGCAALAFAEVAKKCQTRDNDIKILILKDEPESKEGEDN